MVDGEGVKGWRGGIFGNFSNRPGGKMGEWKTVDVHEERSCMGRWQKTWEQLGAINTGAKSIRLINYEALLWDMANDQVTDSKRAQTREREVLIQTTPDDQARTRTLQTAI
jgi:hypothetical protein